MSDHFLVAFGCLLVRFSFLTCFVFEGMVGSLILKLNPLEYLQRQPPMRLVHNLSSSRKLAVLVQRVLVVK